LGTVGAPGKLPVIAAQLSIMLVTPQKARRGPGCGQISERCLFVHEIRFRVYRSELYCQKLYLSEVVFRNIDSAQKAFASSSPMALLERGTDIRVICSGFRSNALAVMRNDDRDSI
jgi:hypothetical protein